MPPVELTEISERVALLEQLSSSGRLFLDILNTMREKDKPGLEELLIQFDGDMGKAFASLDIVTSHTLFQYEEEEVHQNMRESKSFTLKIPDITVRLPQSLKMLYVLEYLEAPAKERTAHADASGLLAVAQAILETAMADRQNIAKTNGCLLVLIGVMQRRVLSQYDKTTAQLYENDRMVQNAIAEEARCRKLFEHIQHLCESQT